MQQNQLNQNNRIQQTPTPPPQSHQQSAPLLAQLQTPTSSSQVNVQCVWLLFLNINLINFLINVTGRLSFVFSRRWAYDCTSTTDYH